MKQTAISVGMRMALAAFLMTFVISAPVAAKAGSARGSGIVLRAYGPNGPAPAMREAAKVFGAKKGVAVEITAGPAKTWKDQAMQNADLIYSGSENMMTDYVQKSLPGLIDASTIQSLCLRPSAILVRPGNPKGIRGVKDLARPGIRVLVVEGDGQVGMWEDVAGRTGDIGLVDRMRRNIGFFAVNSAEAKKLWNSDTQYDA